MPEISRFFGIIITMNYTEYDRQRLRLLGDFGPSMVSSLAVCNGWGEQAADLTAHS